MSIWGDFPIQVWRACWGRAGEDHRLVAVRARLQREGRRRLMARRAASRSICAALVLPHLLGVDCVENLDVVSLFSLYPITEFGEVASR